MTRQLEKRLTLALGIWQIIDGLITILYYGVYKLGPLSGKLGQAPEESAIAVVNSSMFTLVCTFGSLLIGLGLMNLVMAKRYLKNEATTKKIGLFLLGQGLFSYFILDIPSMVLSITCGVIYFAKNKAIKRNLQQA